MMRRTSPSSEQTSSTQCSTSIHNSKRDVWPKESEETLWNKGNPYDDTGFDEYKEGTDYSSRCTRFKHMLWGFSFEFGHFYRAASSKAYIWLTVLLVFASITLMGLYTFRRFCHHRRAELISAAMWHAMDIENSFDILLRQTFIPLFSVQQAVLYSDAFKALPYQIGNYGEKGSAPVISGPVDKNTYDFRNVTGICDDAFLIETFSEIVETANKNAQLDGIIVNYRLVPNNVFCLAEPLINDKDFDEGVFDSTNVIGRDVMHTPGNFWYNTIRNVYNEDLVDIMGPFNYTDIGFDLPYEGYCEHVAVNLPGYNITIDGVVHNSWGFVQSFVNWSKMKELSGINERLGLAGLEFHVTKNETTYDTISGTYQEEITAVARSDRYHVLHDMNSVVKRTSNFNGDWTIRVGYEQGFMLPRHRLWNFLVVFLSFVVTLMLAMILVEKMQYRTLLHKIMPKRAVKKLQTGRTVVERYNIVTIFFSDIVGFTKMAGEMGPLQTMKMLNDLYCAFDKLVDKHGVYKVETIGDSYMVVGGAPSHCPAPEAAEKVGLFALDAIKFVETFTAPNGEHIKIRGGIASGPVVAGVVGKAMPRYCFFGNTVNLASRMESTSENMKIQCSDLTGRILNDSPNVTFSTEKRIENGHSGVYIKGKGLIHTWWIKSASKRQELKKKRLTILKNPDIEMGDPHQHERIIPEEHELTSQYLSLSNQPWRITGQNSNELVVATADKHMMVKRCAAILDARLVNLISAKTGGRSPINPEVRIELHSYVEQIELRYNDVEYHSFEHASHVMISMNRLIFQLEQMNNEDLGSHGARLKDPLVIFTLLLAALVHDVCHYGKSNSILRDQQHQISKLYPKHYAERFSMDTAIELLLNEEFSNFRDAFIPDTLSKLSFVKLFYCSLLITDIALTESVQGGISRFHFVNAMQTTYHDDNKKADKETDYDPTLCPLTGILDEICLKVVTREDKEKHKEQLSISKSNLELCMLSEHLMQTCDVAHLMQGWKNYVKWNFRLYKELLVCHREGLIPDPSTNWVKGQTSFVEAYVYPLAARTESSMGNFANLQSSTKENNDRWGREGSLILNIFVSGIQNSETEDQILQKCFSL